MDLTKAWLLNELRFKIMDAEVSPSILSESTLKHFVLGSRPGLFHLILQKRFWCSFKNSELMIGKNCQTQGQRPTPAR